MTQNSHERFVIRDDSDPGALRRAVSRYAVRLRATAEGTGRAELVATELATNLLRHAKPGGWVLARAVPPACVELIAVDRGPGIADVAAAVEGRTSTPGGLGCGLATVRRACAHFDLHTAPGRGTAVLAVVNLEQAAKEPTGRPWAGVSIGVTEPCGDRWAVSESGDAISVVVVDGLGHGVKAAAAADEALRAFAVDPADIDGFLDRANAATRETRGAAVAMCRLWPGLDELRYLAVGNLSARIVSGDGSRGLTFHNGTLGMQSTPPRVKAATYAWPRQAMVVIWTDGLGSRLDLCAEPGLLGHDPAVVAAVLHRDYSREHDDATVVVVRNQGKP